MTLSRSAKVGITIGLLLSIIAVIRTNAHRTSGVFYRGLLAGEDPQTLIHQIQEGEPDE